MKQSEIGQPPYTRNLSKTLRSILKHILIPYIAIGLMLSGIIGLGYPCDGYEFIHYYGSPFIYKKASLGSSMTYYYSISGLLANSVLWITALYFIRWLALKTLGKLANNFTLKLIGILGLIVLVALSSLVISFSYITTDSRFEPEFNYWYIDLGSEEERWEKDCTPELLIMK